MVLAVGPTLFNAKVPFLSANPGPSQLAGKQCNPYFFGTSYQNDAMHEAAGKHAADKGYKKVVVLAPNYPAGKDAVNGFKRAYAQPVQDEVYTKVGQLDFAAEIAQLRAAKPDAVYIFQPGGMGINFIKQFMGAGLNKDMVLISSPFTADQDIIAAVGEPMVGIYNASSYAHDLDNAANKQFVAEFQKAYGRLPTLYAAFAYDVVMNMDAAVKATGGKVDDKAALPKRSRPPSLTPCAATSATATTSSSPRTTTCVRWSRPQTARSPTSCSPARSIPPTKIVFRPNVA